MSTIDINLPGYLFYSVIVFATLKVCEHVGNLCKLHIATVDTVSIPYTSW